MKTTAQTGANARATLSHAIDGLWDRFLPDITERVVVLESAAKAVAGRKLSAKQREAAQAAAHKLAGVLGTFGLTRGTVLARELELTFSRESSPGPEASAKLGATVAELRSMVESRKSST
jgi:HPt (histidine-containing phosphotransfer) domain-containing protein